MLNHTSTYFRITSEILTRMFALCLLISALCRRPETCPRILTFRTSDLAPAVSRFPRRDSVWHHYDVSYASRWINCSVRYFFLQRVIYAHSAREPDHGGFCNALSLARRTVYRCRLLVFADVISHTSSLCGFQCDVRLLPGRCKIRNGTAKRDVIGQKLNSGPSSVENYTTLLQLTVALWSRAWIPGGISRNL